MNILVVNDDGYTAPGIAALVRELRKEHDVFVCAPKENQSAVGHGLTLRRLLHAEKVTVFDIFFANSQGKFYALFLVIFAVLFSTADIGSGYIKNIGGQVQKRGALIFSRAIALAVFTVLTMAGAFLLQGAANYIVFKELTWGSSKAVLSYFLTELALHYALVLICMAIAIILKNNVISMVIAICLTMNIMSIVYGLINSAVRKMGIQNFQIYKYTITGKLSLLSMNPSRNECLAAFGVAIVFAVIMIAASSAVFQKRDI